MTYFIIGLYAAVADTRQFILVKLFTKHNTHNLILDKVNHLGGNYFKNKCDFLWKGVEEKEKIHPLEKHLEQDPYTILDISRLP